MLILWLKSKVVLDLFLGENEGLSCLVCLNPKSISADPVGFTSIVLLPKIASKKLEFT